MAAKENAVCGWDFTLSKDAFGGDYMALAKLLANHCKSWCFQLERSECGFVHYQGRIKLKVKKRTSGVRLIVGEAHWSKTSRANQSNMFYVMKEETRIDGPWSDKDDILPIYVPRQIREVDHLMEWQKEVIRISKVWDTRTVNYLYDPIGGTGKSIIGTYMGVHKLAVKIPFANDYKDVMRMVMDRPKRGCYLIDMPRAIRKEKLFQLFSAIESIKNGYAYDDRYSFKEEYFDCPCVWIFSNKLPDQSLLTRDRWKFWQIQAGQLVDYDPDPPEVNEEIMAFINGEPEYDD